MEKKQAKKPWLWYALAAVLVLADQVVKNWVRQTMALGERKDLWPFLELYHVENTGGAFSIFSGFTWVLAVLSAVVTMGMMVAMWKGLFGDWWFSRLSATLILAGAAGNLIDRALLGAVTDMFNFTFMRFGVFNVADVWVVSGVIAFVLAMLFGPKEDDHGSDHPRE